MFLDLMLVIIGVSLAFVGLPILIMLFMFMSLDDYPGDGD